MSCKGSMTYFRVNSITCKACCDYERCRNDVIDSLTKLGMKQKVDAIKRRVIETVERKIPAVDENMPVIVRERIRALYRRGFTYRAGQKENPFGMGMPAALSLIYDELFRREKMSKREIRQAVIDGLGWGDRSAKVEVSRIVHVMTFVGIALLKDGMLVFRNDNIN